MARSKLAPKVPLPVDRSPNPTTCLVPGPVRPMMPNDIRIRSAVFPQYTGQADAPTDRPTHRPTDRQIVHGKVWALTIGCCAPRATRPNKQTDWPPVVFAPHCIKCNSKLSALCAAWRSPGWVIYLFVLRRSLLTRMRCAAWPGGRRCWPALMICCCYLIWLQIDISDIFTPPNTPNSFGITTPQLSVLHDQIMHVVGDSAWKFGSQEENL